MSLLLLALCASLSVGMQSLSCDFCVIVFEVGEAYAESQNVSVVVASLDNVCHAHKIFNHSASILKDCLNIAEKAGQALASLPDFTGDAYYPPPVACAILFDSVCKLPCCNSSKVPEQIYTTFGRTASEMRVTWITLTNCSSVVQWGAAPDRLSQTAQGFTTTYTQGGWVGVIHHIYLSPVTPGVPVYYRVGDGGQYMSSVLSLVNPQRGYPVKLAQVGDMGTGPRGAPTMARFEKLTAAGQMDWVLHVGDVAYSDGNEMIYDVYGREIAFATSVPYVLLPGNHEIVFNFAGFRHRFPMSVAPGALGDNLFWAFDMGRVRFVGLNSESVVDTPQITPEEQQWVEAELQASSARKRSGELDWIVVSLHRPLYCSGSDEQCNKFAFYLRDRLEDLFSKSLVDLVLQAHRHNYGQCCARPWLCL